jgi:hypothetical protein
MPPEQALGEWDAVDERADVFALGSILCEILTGRPAYSGEDGEQVLRRARQGDVAEALGRLEQCGADAALTGLCRLCLAAERERRPRRAGVLARRVADYEEKGQERLRRAELENAQAQDSRAEWKRRRGVAALVMGVLFLVLLIRDRIGGDLLWLLPDPFPVCFAALMALIPAVLAWVLWRRDRSLWTQRAIELALFGSVLVYFAWVQLFKVGEENYRTLTDVYNTTWRWFILIILYGVCIPNTRRRCALVGAAMAVIPLVLTPLAAVRHAWLPPDLTPIPRALPHWYTAALLWPALLDMATLLALAVAIAVFGSHRIEIISRPAARRSG